MARQASAERAWTAIANFYAKCKKGAPGKKGFPKFKRDQRSVEYKTDSWKLGDDYKRITFTDGHEIGTLKLKGTRDLEFYQTADIKRVRLARCADGYYCQLSISATRFEELPPSNATIGLDVGLKEFYTDSNGASKPNPRFLRKAEKRFVVCRDGCLKNLSKVSPSRTITRRRRTSLVVFT